MRTSTRLFLTTAMLCAGLAVGSSAMAQTAVVRGRVVAADTGLPVRRAIVSLRNVREDGRGLSTATDAEGTFAFEAVPEGRYRLGASKSRYVDTAVGARAPGRPGRAFELARGQKLEDVTIVLTLAGVIAGRVFDDTGDPVSGATVMARQRKTPDGVPRPVPSGYARSDDTGSYRIFGLKPGRYYLSAAPDEGALRAHDLLDLSGSAFATTYYPSTAVAGEAQTLDVTAGAETFADVALVPTRVTTVSGEVVDAAGRPAMIAMINLAAKGGADGPGSGMLDTSSIRAAGAFSLSGVPPGDYTLTAQALFDEAEMARMLGTGGFGFEGGGFTMPLTVSGAPIANLRVVIPPVVEIAGRVLFEGSPPPGGGSPVSVFAAREAAGETGPRTTVGADGRFTLRVLPGPWRIVAWSPGWMPKRLTFRGRVAEDAFAPIEVDAEPGARLELVLTSKVPVVTGTVSDGDGKPQMDYHVVIFPAERPAPSMARREPHVERPDKWGRFRVDALPPGEYLIAAIADYDAQESLDDELLDALRPAATPVHLAEGRIETVALKLVALP
jgi:protocatechuate 3,4-dioxygenase beta subunit